MTDNQEQIVIAVLLISIGIVCAILYHDEITTLRNQIYQLRKINTQAINLNDTLMHCAPRENGRAIITRKNNQFFCEIHIDRRSH